MVVLKKQDRDFMKIDYKIYFPLIMMRIKATRFGDTYASLDQEVHIKNLSKF